jgi:hypothetical protein
MNGPPIAQQPKPSALTLMPDLPKVLVIIIQIPPNPRFSAEFLIGSVYFDGLVWKSANLNQVSWGQFCKTKRPALNARRSLLKEFTSNFYSVH